MVESLILSSDNFCFNLFRSEITIWRFNQTKSDIGGNWNDGKKDKDEPTSKDIMKSLCKITEPLESIKNQLGKLENISKR